MSQWRKKPVVVEAFQWTGGPDQTEDPEWIVEALANRKAEIHKNGDDIWMEIETLEGVMTAEVGDFIVRGVKGEIYPCKPDIFAETYEQPDPCPGDKALDAREDEMTFFAVNRRLNLNDFPMAGVNMKPESDADIELQRRKRLAREEDERRTSASQHQEDDDSAMSVIPAIVAVEALSGGFDSGPSIDVGSGDIGSSDFSGGGGDFGGGGADGSW